MRIINCIVLFLLLLSSCKKDDTAFKDSFIQINQSSYLHTVKFGTKDYDTLYIEFSVIGKPFKTDQQISLKMDSSYSKYSESGFIVTTPTVLLPADSFSVKHPIIINTEMMNVFSQKSFSIEILQNSTVAENYKKAQISVYKQGLSDVFSGNYYCIESGYSNKYLVALEYTTPISDTIKIKNFWDFSTSDTRIYFILKTDISRSIDLPTQTFTDIQGTNFTVEGTGKYEHTGDFSLDYTLTNTATNVLFEKGTQKYTHVK